MATSNQAWRVVFNYPFRIFFLSTAASALVLVPLWLLFLLGKLESGSVLPPLHWHQHEMLAGFLNSAIAGFLLTAVGAWTGTKALAGRALAGLWLVWLGGRVALLLPWLPGWLAAAIDLAFLPLVALLVALPVAAARQWRQLPLLLVLSALWLADLAFHITADPRWLRVAILLAAALMLAVGGRITPAFSRNWLQARGVLQPPVQTRPMLEVMALGSAVLLAVAEGWPALPAWLIASLAGAACLASAARLWLWRGWLVRSEPLLLVLHLGLLWVVVAYLLRALAAMGPVSDTVWLHALGSGAMGTLILGVMARVALGHTGRPLIVPAGIVAAAWLVVAAGLLRVVTGLQWLDWSVGVYASALCWVAAFALFWWRYFPVLIAPRVDGKVG